MRDFKIIVEKHSDGYIAYPLGVRGIVVGEGNTYDEAVLDVKSALAAHIETFGVDTVEAEDLALGVFVAEIRLANTSASTQVEDTDAELLRSPKPRVAAVSDRKQTFSNPLFSRLRKRFKQKDASEECAVTGDIIPYLIQKGYTTEAQVADALASPLPIERALLMCGVTQAQIDEAWKREIEAPSFKSGLSEYAMRAQRRGQPFVDLSKFRPDPDAVYRIPNHLAWHHNVIPIKKDSNILYVAMPDADDMKVLSDVRLVARCHVRGVIADPEQIRAAIATYYGETA